MSKASSTDGAEDQRLYTDEQPATEQDTLRRTEDSEEQANSGPSTVKLPSETTNIGPSQSSEPHEQERTSKDAPDSNPTLQGGEVMAEKDQPNPSLSELTNVMKDVLDVLQNSTIASKSGKDDRSRFWGVYKRVAEEHDGEFLERYTTDMDIVLIFSGLFSAVSSAFIVAMESDLSPDPSDTTNALLKQIVQIGLGDFTAAGSAPADPASTWSPAASTVRIQMVVYASLSMSLLAAFGAVLGKQWLGYYKTKRYGRGSQEDQGKRRQEKFEGLVAWYFDAVVQSFPVLLQISLLLFGVALGANMWHKQPGIAWVIISTTAFGFLFYSLTVMACLISPACPFQTPISIVLQKLHMDKVLRPAFKRVFSYFQQLTTSAHGVLQRLLGTVRSRWTRMSEVLAGPVRATGAFAGRSFQLLFAMFHKGLHFFLPHSSAKVVDAEAQSLDQDLDVLKENDGILTLDLPDTPVSDLEAPSIKWLLETSTDPEAFLAASRLVPQVEWPLDFDISDILPLMYDSFTSCVDIQGKIVPSLGDKASACAMALTHLYYRRFLRAYPTPGEFIVRGEADVDVLVRIYRSSMLPADKTVLDTAINPDFSWWSVTWPETCPDSVLQRLSHLLPYHFVTERVSGDIENLAIKVISNLLSSPSSPSNLVVANCTLLACLMVGIQVDKKDIVRIDKSHALPRLRESLFAQFQQALWAWDGGELYEDSTGVTRRAWSLIDIIYRILELAGHSYHPPFRIMRNLGVCKKIYSRAKSSDKYRSWNSLTDLRKALHFTFAAAGISQDPAQMWDQEFEWEGESHSPGDFDWMVDCLAYIDADDHEMAYATLFLLGSMKVCCSPTKQHLFIERLITYMDSHMPLHLRHAALCAAHSAREEIASIDADDARLRDIILTKLSPATISIDVIDDARLRDMVFTKVSSAIMTAVCPHPGTTPSNDGPDRLFNYNRDICYLELLYALARNSNWHPHLSRNGHIDRCISMIPVYCVRYFPRAFYIAGILLQIASEQTLVTSLDSLTEQQWWDVMRSAWYNPPYDIYSAHCFQPLLVLVDGTNQYMRNASKSDLEDLLGDVDGVLRRLKREMGPEMQNLEQGERITTAVEELRNAVSKNLESRDQ